MVNISTILVMGPPASGKSDFIKLLAGPLKLKPNAVATDELRSLAISPYFPEDGTEIVRLVKFPGFNLNSADPTDAELLVQFAVYLEGLRRRQEPISGIVYMHRIDDYGMNAPGVDRNFRMLSKIAGDQQYAARNVIIVTTGWENPVPQSVDRDANQANLQTILTSTFNSDQFMPHDGSKWSALRIVNILKRKTPTLLCIQIELANNADPAFTSAAVEMVGDLDTFIQEKRVQDDHIRDQLRIARRDGNKDKATKLANDLTQSGVLLDRLRAEEPKLEAPVDWDQATKDNVLLEAKITEQYALATTDWKAEYDKMKVEAANWKSNYDAVKANYDALVSSSNAVTDTAFNHSLKNHPIKANSRYAGYGIYDASWPDWLGYEAGEVLYTNGYAKPTTWGNVYRVCNSAGRVGVAYTSHFSFV